MGDVSPQLPAVTRDQAPDSAGAVKVTGAPASAGLSGSSAVARAGTVATDAIDLSALDALVGLLRGRRVVVLAGAGCSTESGIPDYRGPDGSLRTRKPIQYQDFVRSESARARYWARSAIGWPRMATARPNECHRALAALEERGAVRGLITQNVDGLHHAAGSRRVVELHGSLATVCCLTCGRTESRDEYQERLRSANPAWWPRWMTDGGLLVAPGAESGPDDEVSGVASAPDGDAELAASATESFRVVPCAACGGILKPDVVFFGENVPPARLTEAWRVFDEGEVLLVVGSSLTVYSGRRFVHRAQERGLPVAIVNLGPTRADEVAAAKVEGRVGELLPRLAAALIAAT